MNIKTAMLTASGFCLTGILSSSIYPEKMGQPNIEFSADEVMETAEFKMESKIYKAINKERKETNMAGHKSIMIMRFDKKVIWQLMPDQKMYMEKKMEQDDPKNKMEDPTALDIEKTEVGPETINGLSCIKYKIITTSKDGTKMGGFMWIATKEQVMVKMDAIAKSEKSKNRVKIELKNIKFDKQPSSLFEIPPEYTKMVMPDMNNMPDLKGMMPKMP